MGEERMIETTLSRPATIPSLATDLKELGVKGEMTLLVHSSLSSLGWVCGGAVAVILALEQVLGEGGTLVMPTHSGDLTDPTNWQHPPVPESWWQPILDHMPLFDPELTPTREMGVIPETFRKQRGVLRSDHPTVSFSAWGAAAERVTTGHSLDYCMGENSPLARIYDLSGWVLLLGVEHHRNTSLHLAEYRADLRGRRICPTRVPLLVDGERRWVQPEDYELDAADFHRLVREFESEGGIVNRGKVALADAMLIPQRDLIDFAVPWLESNRG